MNYQDVLCDTAESNKCAPLLQKDSRKKKINLASDLNMLIPSPPGVFSIV